MAESQPPKWVEEILSLLSDLNLRMDEVERQVQQLRGAGPAAQRPPTEPPPLPPEALRPVQPAPAPPAETAEPIPLPLQPDLARAGRGEWAAAEVPAPAADAPAPARGRVPQWLAPPREPRAPQRSIEQVLGTKWLLIAGVALLLLGGGFFFRYALAKGWIDPPARCIMGTITALVVIGLGEWALRRKMALFAAGLFGVGVVWLYYTCWAASPNGPYYPEHEMISRPTAFALMCVVTLLGVGLSIRADMLTGGIIAVVGAFATPFLLRSGRDQQVALMSYMLLVNAGFLVLAYVKRWQALAPIAAGATALLFLGWFDRHYSTGALLRTSEFAWSFFALFGAYAIAATFRARAHEHMGIALMAAGGGLLAWLWVGMDCPDGAFLAQLLVLEAIVLAACLHLRWNWLRFGVLAWTVAAAALQWLTRHAPGAAAAPLAMTWSGWLWGLFALLTADVIVRTFQRRFRTDPAVDAVIATVAMGAMFAATYWLLDGPYHAWMGLYTACLGAAAVAAAWAISRLEDRRGPAYAYFGQGLVLVILAAPIQFDKFAVTLAWAVMAIVAMFLARRLPNRILAVTCPVVLALAVVHFLGVDLPTDPRMARVLVSAGGVTITNGLAIAVGLTAALLAATAILRAGRPILDAGRDGVLAGLMVAAALLLFAYRTAWELPAVTATGGWLVLAGGLVAVSQWRRSGWLSAVAAGGLLAAAIKWAAYDTLICRVRLGADLGRVLVVNGQFAVGLAAMGIMWAHARLLRARQIRILLDEEDLTAGLCGVLSILGAVLIVWGGSFEVDRYFAGHAARFEDPILAEHMALSLWWGLYAAVLLATGFVGRSAGLRYVAIAVFGLTIGKVFIVDMRGVEAVYRILSFLGLGVLLLAASWLYHRFFRGARAGA